VPRDTPNREDRRLTTRVYLADDHTMFREGLESILASREGLEVVGSTSTGPKAAAQVGRTKPDVVVTQLDMQPKAADEIIEGLREASPTPGSWCSPCGTTCDTCRPSPRWA
jgi:DNA-binding NarL/FixJ family response regulator